MCNKLFLHASLLILLFVLGCSHNGNPISPENQSLASLNDIPIISITNTGETSSSPGVMGAYELTINPDEMTAELISKRIPTIGESYIVSGINFFTMLPCSDCLKIVDYTLDSDGNLVIKFSVKHPFEPGNTSLPPSAINRLDLNIFDLAMLVKPQAGVPQSYPLTAASVYSGVILNACGYTKELKNVVSDNSALPFVPVVDDSISGVSTWNEFSMGVTKEFEVIFKMTVGTPLRFDIYLTMGYGASAKLPDRLNPKYYNPEFNRKAAWKVEVTPQGKWLDNNNTTPVNVEVKVYDWQIGANIYGTPSDFANAPASDIYAASDVASVSVEIPGMNSALLSATTPDSGDGTPSNPLIFNIPVVNQNLLPADEYNGIVKVLDERPCLPVTDGRDFIINSPDGFLLDTYVMPEYATYQAFNASVVSGLCWVIQEGGASGEQGFAVTTCSDDSIVVTGSYSNSATFGGGDSITKTLITDGPGWDIFVAKYSPEGSLAWVTRAGSFPDEDIPRGITALSDNSTVITGYFRAIAYFGTGESNQTTLTSAGGSDIFIARYNTNGTLAWAKRAGGSGTDVAYGITTLSDNSTIVTGEFTGSAIFGSGEANQTTLTSSGFPPDIFIAKYNSNGTLTWAKRAGGTSSEYGRRITSLSDNSSAVTGYFSGSAIFGQGEANETTLNSGGSYNIFIVQYNSDGTLAWAKQAGGTNDDVGEAITSLSDNSTVATGYIVGSGTFGEGELNQTTLGAPGSSSIFIAHYNTNGTLAWAKQAGEAAGSKDGYGITTLSNDSTVVTGYFGGSITFGPGEPNQTILTSSGNDDIFIAQYNADGTLAWAKRAGGTGNDEGWGIATLSDNSTVTTGYFTLTATFGGGESNQTTLVSAGSADIFVARNCY